MCARFFEISFIKKKNFFFVSIDLSTIMIICLLCFFLDIYIIKEISKKNSCYIKEGVLLYIFLLYTNFTAVKF